MEKEENGKLPEGNENLELDDLDDESAENEEESAEKDEPENDANAEEGEKPVVKDKPKKQSRSTDAKYAELKRKSKAQDEEIARLKAEKEQAVFDAKKNAIPRAVLDDLGLDEIEDEDDMYLVKAYQEAEAKGSDDPRADAEKAFRNKIRQDKLAERAEAEEKAKTEEANKKAVADDYKSFMEKYGKSAFESAMAEGSEFQELFGDEVGFGNLTSVYGRYLKIKAKFAKDEDDSSKRKGGIPNPSSKSTSEEVGKPETDAEFKKRFMRQYGSW